MVRSPEAESGEALEQVIRGLRPFLEPVAGELASDIAQQFILAAAPIAERAHQHIQDLEVDAEEVAAVLQVAGLWFTRSMPLGLLVELIEMHQAGEADPASVQESVLDRYRYREWELLRETVDGWQDNPSFGPRITIIRHALEAHLQEKYTLSIAALLPQIEGVIRDITQWDGVIRDRVKEAVGATSAGVLVMVMDEIAVEYYLSRVYTRRTEVEFETFEQWLAQLDVAETDVLNRHMILHGRQTNYGSEINSLRAFLLLDVLSKARQ